VLVEMPPPRRLELLRRERRPADFQLFVDGISREVVSAGPAATPGPSQDWEIVVYLDPELAPAVTLSDAARLLAERAERLTGLGSVEIVLADPEPRVALAASRDVARWPAALLELAGSAEGRAEALPAGRLPDLVRRQTDRLIAFAGRSREGGRPRALLWVGAADLPISPTEQSALSGATSTEGPPPRPSSIAAAFVAAAQALAADGWVTLPLVVRPLPPPPPPELNLEAKIVINSPEYTKSHPFSGSLEDPKVKARRASAYLALDAPLLPWLAPLQLLATATAGQVVQEEIQLDSALDSLGRRWQLWYSPPEDGRLHRLAVSLDGKRLRAPAWMRGFPPNS
jgi:hypothetical protein